MQVSVLEKTGEVKEGDLVAKMVQLPNGKIEISVTASSLQFGNVVKCVSIIFSAAEYRDLLNMGHISAKNTLIEGY